MLRLLLLRHAKAAWPSGVHDTERPLAKRGREAVEREISKQEQNSSNNGAAE